MKIINITVSLIIIFFLISIIASRVLSQGTCQPTNFTCSNMASMKQALKMFKLDNGNYPSTKEGLEALVKNPNPQKYSNYGDDGYIEKLPLDSWENPFRYNHYKTDKGDDFQLISFGADGKYGGEGENEDIVYPDCRKQNN